MIHTISPEKIIQQLKQWETVPRVWRLHFQRCIHVHCKEWQERLGMFHHQVWPPCEGLWDVAEKQQTKRSWAFCLRPKMWSQALAVKDWLCIQQGLVKRTALLDIAGPLCGPGQCFSWFQACFRNLQLKKWQAQNFCSIYNNSVPFESCSLSLLLTSSCSKVLEFGSFFTVFMGFLLV